MNLKVMLNSSKLFIKTINCAIPYIMLLVIINYFLMNNCTNTLSGEPLIYFGRIRNICFALFAFYLFISYEFFRKTNDTFFYETLEAYGLRGKIVQVSQLFVLITCILISSFNIAIYSIIGYIYIDVPKAFLSNIVIMNIIDIFLISVTATFIGILISKLKNRFVGYTILALILICVSPAINEILYRLNYSNIPLYKIRDLINLLPPDLDAMAEKLYGLPLEAYRFAIMMAWILLVSTVLAFVWLKNKKNIQRIMCIVLSLGFIISLFVYFDKGSILLSSNHPEASTEDVFKYYTQNESKQYNADFEVGIYDMELKIDNKLTATVSMQIAQESISDIYRFTLYHNYKIKKVYDEAKNKLEFKQHGDYFDVIKPDGNAVNNIIVEYSGHSETFYSNKHAVFLPGFFAYYPQPGYNMVFSLKNYNYVSTVYEPSKFSVNVESNLQLASNLKVDSSRIEGVSQNLTLVGGFYEEIKINNEEVILYPLDKDLREPLSQVLSNEYQNRTDEIKTLLGEVDDVVFRGKKIINIPFSLSFNTLLSDIYVYKDSIIVNPRSLINNAYAVFNAYIPNSIEKQDLKKCFLDTVRRVHKGEELFLFADKGIETKSARVNDMLALKILDFGVDYVAPIVYEYLKDESNSQDTLEFLTNIK